MNGSSQRYNAIVAVAFSALAVLIVLALLFPDRIKEPMLLIQRCLTAAAAGAAIVFVSERLGNPWRVLLRITGVVWLTSFLFDAVSGVQWLIFSAWQDEALMRVERLLTGTELSLQLERLINHALTEWLMTAYVLYIPLLPLTAWLAYRAGGESAAYDYLLALLIVNLLCDAGFVLYPIASQLFYNPDQYTVPLTGGIFTWMAEWVRANMHYPGGSFPSPHNAAGTVMFWTLWRWNRKWAAAMTPFLLSIPLATVYGRFHYISDGIVGILLASAVLYVLQRTPAVSRKPVFVFRASPDATVS